MSPSVKELKDREVSQHVPGQALQTSYTGEEPPKQQTISFNGLGVFFAFRTPCLASHPLSLFLCSKDLCTPSLAEIMFLLLELLISWGKS